MFDLDAYLHELEKLVNIDSGSYNVAGINSIGDFFASKFEECHWIVRHVNFSNKVGNLLDIQSDDRIHKDVLIIGHIDTVFPKGEAAKRPFRISEGLAYGPGVADMKCGLLAIWHALKDIPDCTKKLSIRVIMNPDEEINSVYSTEYIEKAAAQADYAFVMEPAMVDGSFCIERKGRLEYEFEFTGIPDHAGYKFDRVNASAIDEMALWINEFNSFSIREKGTTVNVGKVAGGSMNNIVAEHATMGVEFRMWEKSEAKNIKKAVEFRLTHPIIEGIKVKQIGFSEKKVLQPSEETLRFTKRMKKIYEARNLPFAIRRCGGVSDSNTVGAYTPVVIDRIGPWGDNNHSSKEFMVIKSAEYSVELLKDILSDIAKNG